MSLPTPEPAVVALCQKFAKEGALISEDGVWKRVLSVHAHRLREAEAVTNAISFSTFNSLQEYRFYLREEDRLAALFAAWFGNPNAFYCEPSNSTGWPLKRWQLLISLTTTGLREKRHCLFCIRRLNLLLASADNLNVAVYFLDPQQQATLAELVSAYQLHLLSW